MLSAPFLLIYMHNTCENTNEDKHVANPFEDVEIMEMMTNCHVNNFKAYMDNIIYL